ncbi:MAG: hypothetical protein HY757_10570 [Nitrospirae bacterium]|nr:hypothetical protein [Nitrospirota bacterium]
MNKFVLTLLTLAVTFLAGMSFAIETQVQTGFHYDWWDDTKDNEASQSYIPLRIEAEQDKMSFSILTGYANTHVNFTGQGSKTLSNMLDTKLNFRYGISDKLPLDVVLGIGFNLPTGKTNFEQDELVLIMDSDLISINKFGEGYNVNPTISVAKEWGDLAAGFGLGYLWRGEYDFSKSLQDYNPGDIFNTSIELDYYFNENWQTRIFSHYAWFDKDKVDGEDFFQEGGYCLLGVGVNYRQVKWDAAAGIRSIFRNKSRFQDTSGGIFTEDRNNHGNEWQGDLAFRYFVDGRTTLKSSLQALLVDKNDYPEGSSNFVGRREKYSLTLGASRVLSANLEGEISVKGFIMQTGKAEFPQHTDPNNYRGISPAVYLISRF